MSYEGKENSVIWLGYTVSIHGICQHYSTIWIDWLINAKKMMQLSQNSHVQNNTSAGDMISSLKMNFLFSMNIWQVYTRFIPSIYISHLSCSHLAGLPGLPSAPGCLGPGLSADPFSFGAWNELLATKGPPTLGWELPNFHRQSLISKTWLLLRDAGPWPSEQLNSKACFCRPAYLYE